ncbi:MAG: hypothetical protein ABUT20_26360 [Bacteroidota bacterium]
MWCKQGLIFTVENNFDWMVSHAAVPTAMILPGGDIRIFFAPRNSKGQSIPTFIDVKGDNPSEILNVHDKPILELGKLGAFDDSGIMPCSVTKYNDQIYLYYVGWNPGVSVPYRNAIGMALSNDGGLTFERMFEGPVVDRNTLEPYFTASPCVFKDDETWHMWYASSTGFAIVNGKPEPLYVIKYASSSNGIEWMRENITCIYPLSPFEANARPSVIKEDNVFKMWFTFRGSFDYRDGKDGYRIGYAESNDGRTWQRMDDAAGIDVSEDGWDSKMITYPFALPYKERKYLFYNGNGFGRSGIGYAVWSD